MSWTQTETVRRWIARDRGSDQWWTLQALIKRHIGQDRVPLDEFARVLGVPREVVVAHAKHAHADTLRSMADAGEFSSHEVGWLERCASNLREICDLRPPDLERDDPGR